MLTTRTKNAAKTTTTTTLPDWQADAKVRELHALIARGESGLPDVEARAHGLKAQLATTNAKIGEATSLAAFGLGDAEAEDALRAESDRLTRELADAEKTAATVRQGLTQARTALPAVEARARQRVAKECEEVYVQAAESFTSAVEEAARSYMVLIGLHDQLGQAFPGGHEGESFVHALGLVRPPAGFDPALRPPEASWTPQAQPLHWWRAAMRQMRGTPAAAHDEG